LTNNRKWFLFVAMRKGLSFIIICLMLLSFLGEAFHHHNDGADHPECSICVAAHQKSDAAFATAPFSAPKDLSETAYNPSIINILSKTLFSPSLGRAPPA
jgi:hypothetical protein